MPEHIRPAPNRAERAKSSLVQNVENLELLVDGFGAFNMKDGGQRAGLDGRLDVLDAPADANAILRTLARCAEGATPC